MANRDELLIIRAARAGQAVAQLALGKRYLFGGGGLPKSLSTALHWLERAAEQNQRDAWILIGTYIPYDVSSQVGEPLRAAIWYERAFEEGQPGAGLVLAMLVFANWSRAHQALQQKALQALHFAAESGLPQGQWLLAQQKGAKEFAARSPIGLSKEVMERRATALEWAARAAKGGILDAQRLMADSAWREFDYVKYLFWALPIAHDSERRTVTSVTKRKTYTEQDLQIFSRCATALLMTMDTNTNVIDRYLKILADSGESKAQFSLGLWMARMDHTGTKINAIPGVAHYKKAIRWLSQAAEQGLSAAWYVMSRIYLKPEFSRRCLAEARRHLEMAAKTGHMRAQLELGLAAWRGRRNDPRSDIRALYWLQQARDQGSTEAIKLIKKITQPVRLSEWARIAREKFNREMSAQYPFLVVRIELGYWFGLTRAEALLLQIESADHGHCLEVDIREEHPRSRRRLIEIKTGEKRQALERFEQLREKFSEHATTAEGNYRQRLYRFRNLMSIRKRFSPNNTLCT